MFRGIANEDTVEWLQHEDWDIVILDSGIYKKNRTTLTMESQRLTWIRVWMCNHWFMSDVIAPPFLNLKLVSQNHR